MRGRVGGVVGPSSRIHGAPVQPPLGHWSERPAPGPEAKRIRPERLKQTPWGLVNPKSRGATPVSPGCPKVPGFPGQLVASVCDAWILVVGSERRCGLRLELSSLLHCLRVLNGRGRVVNVAELSGHLYRSGCRGVSIPHSDLTGGKTPVLKPRRRRPESTCSACPRTHSRCLHTHGTASIPTPHPIQVHPSGVMWTGPE